MANFIPGIKRGISKQITHASHISIKQFHSAMNQLRQIGFDADMVNSITRKLIQVPGKGIEAAINKAVAEPELFKLRAEELKKTETVEKGKEQKQSM